MKILALEKEVEGIRDEQFTPALLKNEAMRAWGLHQQGIIRELYFRQDRYEAVLMLECSTVDEARSVLSTLPLVRAGLIAFDIVPLIPYDGFKRLFANEMT
ncbi:MAG: superoxide dismutase [Ignavibacteriae bacterium]|nr:MAG: superoxide dismutase [Ignavibacteriota bacterium]